MDTFHAAADLGARVSAWRRAGARIGFVPTMGNLHAGHFSLVELARAHADKIIASVFVNPTQFGPSEDFASYPRTLAQDQAGLAAHGCDALFVPGVDAMYPFGAAASVRVEVPGITEILEGELRPGHFAGVATVVTKLFNLVQPDVAVFGQKDYQQLLVIRRMTEDLCLPIRILAAPTRREANGLAMSSRNQYLSSEERDRAAVIYRTLCAMSEQLHAGRSHKVIEADARAALEAAGSVPDYAVIRRASDLTLPDPAEHSGLIALIATRLGRARLIDNLLMGP
ncbi:MAG: pantoate--beta-alanine ligase, partial [Xanthomonadaceae bacterium]|nr:pantoate--beta-alanine ligase [Xanthomonadaceae bacterium]